MYSSELVSIIIPVYNTAPYLQKCVQSVLNQTYQHLEVILVDDGSPDDCPAICDAYAASDDRVHVIHQTNAGLAHARNVGTQSSNGMYIAYLDSDDYWELDSAIEEMMKIVIDQSPDVVLYGFRKHNLQTGNEIQFCVNPIPNADTLYQLKKKLLRQRKYTNSSCAKLMRCAFLREHAISFPVGRKSEDLIWSRRVLSEAAAI